MGPSKAFDTLNYGLLVAELLAYGFVIKALKLLHCCFTKRWQKQKKIQVLEHGQTCYKVSLRGFFLGIILFNLYLNDLFYFD